MGRVLLSSIFLLSLSIQAQDCPTISEADAVQDLCKMWENNKPVPLTVSSLEPKGVDWYSASSGGDPLSADHELVDGGTYYADTGTCEGERPAVSVKIENMPVAGRTSQVYICSDAGEFDLQSFIASTTDGRKSMAEGNFVPPLASGRSMFNLKSDSARTYEYHVSNACGEDDTEITVFVVPAPNPGVDGTADFLSTDKEVDLRTFLGDDYDDGGSWEPALAGGDNIFDPEVDKSGIYTYTVTNKKEFDEGGATGTKSCANSAEVKVTVHEVVKGKVQICHKGKTLSVNANALKGHLGHFDTLGSCAEQAPEASKTVVAPNPSRGHFSFSNPSSNISQVRILRNDGSLVKEFEGNGNKKNLKINLNRMQSGHYYAEVITPGGKEILRLIKE